MNLGELNALGDRLTTYEEIKEKLEADKARVASAQEGLKTSAEAIALLQAELDARKGVIDARGTELAREEASLATELTDIANELDELREQTEDDRKSEDEVFDGLKEDLGRLRGAGDDAPPDNQPQDDGEEAEGQERQGSDNG